MWWLLGMIFFGALFWLVWTSQTHKIGIFTLPGGVVHALLDLHQKYRCKFSEAWQNADYRNDALGIVILFAVSLVIAVCSYFFFAGGSAPFLKFAGAYFLLLILVYTLFLDLMRRT